jgi:diacylglycerol kinase (ATP)
MSGVQEILLFANPIAGRGLGQSIAQRLTVQLSTMGFAVRAFAERADLLDPAAVTAGPAPVAAIVIGGDGTLRAVADVLVRVMPAERMPPLLIVPLGTANLMGQHLGLRWDESHLEQDVTRALQRRRVVQIDAARANGRLCLLMAGIGLDATVVHELDRIRTGPIDLTSYILPAALALQRYDFPSVCVHVDRKQICSTQPALVFIGNIAEYGTGFPVLPLAKSNDGLLDVCVLPCRSRQEILRLLLHVGAGDHLQQEGVIYMKGRHVRVEGPKPVPVQVDGEAFGHTPLEMNLLPHRLGFIVR